jgi:hypothetical protein
MSDARMRRLVEKLEKKDKEIDGLRGIITEVLNLTSVTKMKEMIQVLNYLDTRIVSRAAYEHACIEDKKARDMIDNVLNGN